MKKGVTEVHEVAERRSREISFLVAEGSVLTPNGLAQPCNPTEFKLSYTHEYQPANGLPEQHKEIVRLGYAKHEFENRPLLKRHWEYTPINELVIVDGKVAEPAGNSQIMINDLDEMVAAAFREIPYADVQAALGRSFPGYIPLEDYDILVKNGLSDPNSCVLGVMRIKNKREEQDSFTYFVGIRTWQGAKAAPYVSDLREHPEYNKYFTIKEMPESDYNAKKEELQKDPTFLELFSR